MKNTRLRDLGLSVGVMPPGPLNAITDVPGIWVGHTTLIQDEPTVARTGVTVIVPREDNIRNDYCFAGYHSFNGNGEMTGSHWIDASGLLTSPIGLTNTYSVGVVHDALIEWSIMRHGGGYGLPVVAETFDGWLNDIRAFHVKREHVFAALDNAGPGPVAEGNVGGGTGMICHDFKGGIGTSSRIVSSPSGQFAVGALVQANYGDRSHLRLDGRPLGHALTGDEVPLPFKQRPDGSSIIVVLATDAPLLTPQCRRLAQRATVGLARAGGIGHNGSGDIFLAFATGNHVPVAADAPIAVQMLPDSQIDPFFEAAAEATEEAILNALVAAETMTGFQGRTVYAMPNERVRELVNMGF
ncbi:MAG: P1 family peptidase [Caldilineaceae bacterium]|nr:P1 family peptidase [Caldilineaceae bacterium]MCB9137742.1 P1 family peptidase [Caldilineaceae bacterium]